MIEKLDAKITQALTLKEQIKTLNEELELVKSEIKIELSNNELNTYEDSFGNQLKFKESERRSLDRKMVEQKLAPEILNECFKTSKFETLSILSKDEIDRRKKMFAKK